MAEMKFSELDFLQIKENLKTYLKSQSKFKDYNFDASGISTLLDLLAYNTAYNGFYLNMIASEMFLDSAYMRDNVVSRAKALGYVPSSRRGLSAMIDIEFDFNAQGTKYIGQDPGAGFLLLKKDSFYCVVDTARYLFNPKTEVFVEPLGNRKYIARNVQLIEGKRLTYKWNVDTSSDLKQRYIIPNANVDVSTLQVTVSDTSTSTAKYPYTEFKDLTDLGPEDQIFFLQETSGEKYEMIFGDGILGKQLADGNVIEIEYIVPTNSNAFGVTKFFPVNQKIGSAWNGVGVDTPIIKVVSKIAAKDYSEKESIESIKYSAPRMYDAQNRAVTRNDYEILLKKDMSTIEPKIQYLRVWGGEENDPPHYGKVFCAVKPVQGLRINEAEKKKIIEEYVRPKNIVAVEVEIVEPDYIGLTVSASVNYFRSKTKNTEDHIKSLVLDKIIQFRNISISGFDSDLRLSKLMNQIDLADPSIESNSTQITLKYQILPTIGKKFNLTIPLSNPISKGDAANNTRAIKSDPFYFLSMLVIIGDDGRGNLSLYRANSFANQAPLANIGTVNYETGQIKIQNLIVDSIPAYKNYINLYTTPRNMDVIAYRNQILLLDDADISIQVTDLDRVKLS